MSVHLKEIDKGSRYGDIAIHLARKLKADEVVGSIIATGNLFLIHWKNPFDELKADLEKLTDSLYYARYSQYDISNENITAYRNLIEEILIKLAEKVKTTV